MKAIVGSGVTHARTASLPQVPGMRNCTYEFVRTINTMESEKKLL